MHEEEQGELLWRHIVDVKYDGRADLDGRLAKAESSCQDLRELGALAEDVHRSLNDDPAYAQAAARTRLLNMIYADLASDHPAISSRPRWSLFRLRAGIGGKTTMVLLLVILMATAMAAWTGIAIQQWNECCRRPTPGITAGGGPGADGQPSIQISVHQDPGYRQRRSNGRFPSPGRPGDPQPAPPR